MNRRFLRVISVASAGLAVIAAAGCSSPGSTPVNNVGMAKVSGLEKTTLTVGAVPVADEAGLYIAQERGLFAAEGLHVSILPATSGATASQTIAERA